MATIGIPMNKHARRARLSAARARGAAGRVGGDGANPCRRASRSSCSARSTSISTGALFIAGLLPAATVGVCLMLLVRVRATLAGWPAAARAPRTEIFRTGRRAILPLLMPVILIGGIVGGHRHADRGLDVRGALRPRARASLYRSINCRNFWNDPDRCVDAQRHDLLHRQRGDDLLLGADARRHDQRDRRDDRQARPAGVPARRDRASRCCMGARAGELRHHHHPRRRCCCRSRCSSASTRCSTGSSWSSRSASARSCRRSASRSTSPAPSAARKVERASKPLLWYLRGDVRRT